MSRSIEIGIGELPAKIKVSQNPVNTLVKSINRVINDGGVKGADVLSGIRGFGFRLRIQYSDESIASAQQHYHGSEVTPGRAVLRFRNELRRALRNGGEMAEIASRVMESISFYPGVSENGRS